MEQHPGMAWCVTEDAPARRSCAAAGHDTGTLDTQAKRTAYLWAPACEDETVADIVANLAVGRDNEETRA